MTWSIFGLCEHPEFQTRLREEVSLFAGMPSYDELNSLPFLDAVVRERYLYALCVIRSSQHVEPGLAGVYTNHMIPYSENKGIYQL